MIRENAWTIVEGVGFLCLAAGAYAAFGIAAFATVIGLYLILLSTVNAY